MATFQPGKDDLAFLGMLGFDKEAVELAQTTRELLGIGQETPGELDQLESAAAREAGPDRPADDGAPAPAAAPARAPQRPAAAAPPPPTSTKHLPSRAASPQEPEDEYDEPPRSAPPAAPAEVAAAPEPEPTGIDEEGPTDDEELPSPPLPTRASHGKLFSAPRAHPLHLLDVLNAKYQDAWVDWEPETLWWAIRRDYGAVGANTRNKIEALRTALKTFLPWDDWDTFENCSLAWNDLVPLFGEFQPMTPSQTAFGVTVLRALQPDVEFGGEVKAYIAAVLDEAGYIFAPEEWFDGAQELLDRKLALAPMKSQVEAMWAKAQHMDPRSFDFREDNPIDIHIAKLYAVQAYLAARHEFNQAPAGQGGAASTPTSPPVP